MLTAVVIIAVVIAFIVGALLLKGKTKGGAMHPTQAADSSRPEAPPGYNARSDDPSVRGSGTTDDSSR